MSESERATIPHPQAEVVATARDLADQGNSWARPLRNDAIDQLKQHCKEVINSLAIDTNERAHALTKLEEMTYWMRVGMDHNK